MKIKVRSSNLLKKVELAGIELRSNLRSEPTYFDSYYSAFSKFLFFKYLK